MFSNENFDTTSGIRTHDVLRKWRRKYDPIFFFKACTGVIKTDQTKYPKTFTYSLSQPPASSAVPLDHSGIVVGVPCGSRTRDLSLIRRVL